jgi:hypothetical protein
MAEETIRFEVLDGRWETAGVDRFPGVVPESLNYGWGPWGPDTCSFELKRSPGDIHPDIGAFTPIEIEVAGIPTWAGRIRETPERDDPRSISVAGEGWAYHGDDEQIRHTLLHSDLSAWKDVRDYASLAEVKTRYDPGFEVDSGSGTITVRQSSPSAAERWGGAVLDLGSSTASGVYLEWVSGGSGSHIFAVEAGNSPAGYAAKLKFPFFGPLPDPGTDAAPRVQRSTIYFGAPGVAGFRYVRLLLRFFGRVATLGNVPGAWVTIRAAKVFYDPSYLIRDPTDPSPDNFRLTGRSALTASEVLRQSRPWAPLLSVSNERIAETTFGLPQFVAAGSLREVGEAVNAFHRWRLQVDDLRRIVFEPQPAAPLFEIGDWPGSSFEDASANSGADIYDGVLVSYEDEMGQEATVHRVAAHAGYDETAVEGIAMSYRKVVGASDYSDWLPYNHFYGDDPGAPWGLFATSAGVLGQGFLNDSPVQGGSAHWIDAASTTSVIPRNPSTTAVDESQMKEQRYIDRSIRSSQARIFFWTRTPASGMTKQWGVFGAVARRTSRLSALLGYWEGAGTRGDLKIAVLDGSEVPRVIASTSGTAVNLAASSEYHVRFTCDETVTLELFAGNPEWPGALLRTLGPITLTGSDATKFGPNVAGGAGFRYRPLLSTWRYGYYYHWRKRLLNNDYVAATMTGTGWVPGSSPRPPASAATVDTAKKETGSAAVRLDPRVDQTTLVPADDMLAIIDNSSDYFRRGWTYRIRLRAWSAVDLAAEIGQVRAESSFGRLKGAAAWQWLELLWRPREDVLGAPVLVYPLAPVAAVWVDRVTVDRVVVSLPDRRGFTRTFHFQSQVPLNREAAQIIGDLFLGERRRTPLAGTIKVGHVGVRLLRGGQPVRPSELPRHVGELVRLSHRADPDTGGWGRDARIVAASYDNAAEEASLSIDNRRDNFEALLSRIGALLA